MEKITLLSTVGFTEAQLDKLRAVSSRVEVIQHQDKSCDDLPPGLAEKVRILYGWSGPVREAHRFPRLEWLQTHSAGVDFLLGRPVWQSQVLITTLSGVHAVPIAEYLLAMILAFRWRLPAMRHYQARSEWVRGRWSVFAGPELRGSTLGVIGYGSIGRELARLGHAMGMRVLAANRSGRRLSQRGYRLPGTGDPQATIPEKIYPTGQFLEMLPQCDYVAVLAPLTAETRHMIGAEALARMKAGAFLFNAGRGALIDEAALIDALRNGSIAGAGLDVFETEPLPPDSPLWQMENVIISPHVSGFTLQYDERASDLFAENLRRYLDGEALLNLVDREKGY